jgi:hypothetical protein
LDFVRIAECLWARFGAGILHGTGPGRKADGVAGGIAGRVAAHHIAVASLLHLLRKNNISFDWIK